MKLTALGLILAACCTTHALAQGGDSCTSPQGVIGPGSVALDTTAATLEGHHASCDMRVGSAGAWYNAVDVWYAYTAQITGLVDVRLSGCSSALNSSTASNLSVWNGCGEASSVLCARTTCNSQLSFQVTANQTYLIRAATFASTSSSSALPRRGTATLTFTEIGPPANETCATAVDVGVGTHTWNDTLAQPDGPLPSCSSSPDQATQKDLWFAHTPESSGVTVWTVGGTTGLAVFDACGGTELACGSGAVTTYVTGGVRYVVRIARPAGTAPASGTLTIADYAAPANDACQGAQDVGPGEYTYDDSGATANGPFPSCGLSATAGQRDVWFAYTAATTGITTIDTRRAAQAAPGQNTDTTIGVFSSCDGSSLACTDQSVTRRWICMPVTAGQRYLVRLARAGTATREGGVVRIQEFAPAAGDNCSNAVPLSIGVQSWSNAGNCDLDQFDTPQPCMTEDGTSYLWFVFTPDITGIATFSTAEQTQTVNTVFVAYDSCGGQILDCNSELLHNYTVGSYIALRVTAGVPIYLRVGIVGNTNSYYRLFTMSTDLVPTPAEDECPGTPLPTGIATATEPLITLFDNRVATDSLGVPDPTCNADGNLGITRHDLWWSWTPTESGTTRLSTCRNPAPLLGANTTVISVYSDCTLINQVACNDDWEDGVSDNGWAWPCTEEQSAVSFHTNANTTYVIRVAAHVAYFGPGLLKLYFIPDPCIGDFNNSGGISVQDIFDFLSAYFANSPSADVNNSGALSVQDIFDFLSAYFSGCP